MPLANTSMRHLLKSEAGRPEAVKMLSYLVDNYPDLIYSLSARIQGTHPFDENAEIEQMKTEAQIHQRMDATLEQSLPSQRDLIANFLRQHGPSTRAQILAVVGEKPVKNYLRSQYFIQCEDGRWALPLNQSS